MLGVESAHLLLACNDIWRYGRTRCQFQIESS